MLPIIYVSCNRSGEFTAQFYSKDDIKPILREMYGTDSWAAVADIIEERLAQEVCPVCWL